MKLDYFGTFYSLYFTNLEVSWIKDSTAEKKIFGFQQQIIKNQLWVDHNVCILIEGCPGVDQTSRIG